jgi:hypothetical protein
MQETWKHSIHPATTVTPHAIAGTARINITYRYYRKSYSPKYTPACKCGVEGVLRCVMKKGENLGRYPPRIRGLMVDIIGLVMSGSLLMSLRVDAIGLNGLRWMMMGKIFIP